MTKLTGVGGVLSVAHNSPEGVAHGHSYEVTVWYRHGSDARILLLHLDTVLKRLDHTFLPDELRFGEQLAEHIGEQLPGCIAVDMRRPLERIYARWERDDPHPELCDRSRPKVKTEPCDHEWVIPRFGAEDERECRKCRVSAEEVTRAEDDAQPPQE
jgi:6-pyruvoyl-tetrahydropterin synthase